jgi:hypothetical protein
LSAPNKREVSLVDDVFCSVGVTGNDGFSLLDEGDERGWPAGRRVLLLGYGVEGGAASVG